LTGGDRIAAINGQQVALGGDIILAVDGIRGGSSTELGASWRTSCPRG